jgi:acyl-CoA reductase-like NAD-dependent aldehyde dehydrogenase
MSMDQATVLANLGLGDTNSGAFNGSWLDADGETIEVTSPTTGETIASVSLAGPKAHDQVVNAAVAAFD